MFWFFRGLGVILLVIVAICAVYAGYRALSGVYEYEGYVDGVYHEGCPYPVPDLFPAYGRGVECQWTRSGFSGFDIGMTQGEMLEQICGGNKYGEYLPPLNAVSDPITFPGETTSYVKRITYDELPCAQRSVLNSYSIVSFEREAAALELKRHKEKFTLTFVRGKLAMIDLIRYSQFFPKIDFQKGESFQTLSDEAPPPDSESDSAAEPETDAELAPEPDSDSEPEPQSDSE